MIRTAEGEPLRLRWLASEMDLTRNEDPAVLQVVVVCEGTQRLGLVVDEVQGDTTYVIKRLPWNVKKVRGVVGATHQGDAALSLVVDVPHFFRAQTKNGGEHHLKVAPVTSKIRILVADDSLTSRTLERNILMGAGYDVVVREDGAAALKTLEEEHFHLLVSDVQMPVMDGLELTRQVRRHQRLSRTPIILVTSLERPDDVLAGAEAGADEYIVKGQFDQEALLKAVKRLV
jgi:two-component system chemotaxis sensor kinase CheA